MSVYDATSLDGIAYDDDSGTLVLLLADGDGWDDEAAHLLALQAKLNAYAAFVEGGQYGRVFEGVSPSGFVFDIRFSGPVTENCLKLLDAAGAQLRDELGIRFQVRTGEPG